MKKQIVIATNNANKLKEFKSLFENTPYEVLSLGDINFNGDIKEDEVGLAEIKTDNPRQFKVFGDITWIIKCGFNQINVILSEALTNKNGRID